MRVFAYCRVSTDEQTTENQVLEIATAGFAIEPQRVIAETISGSSAIGQRPGFRKLLDRMEKGDVLVVTKLDRLGRNVMDVAATVDRLTQSGVRVHCLALGGVDLTSSAGRMTMHVIGAVAQFERDLLIERTKAGLARSKTARTAAIAAGRKVKPLGRKPSLDDAQQALVREKLRAGVGIGALAKSMKITRHTIRRIAAKSP